MAKITTSFKRMQIDKANTAMVASIAVAAFVVVFSMIAARALWNKRGYQGRVIEAKEAAVQQLETNLASIDELVIAYKAFAETPDNVIGGNPNGNGERDGDNAKIVLDALPSKYDFPALATSLEKILKSNNYTIDNIAGTDDEIAQSAPQEDGNALPVEIPFDMSASGNIKSVKELTSILERSIRPIRISIIEVSGTNQELSVAVTAKTYYQPEKKFDVQKKVVK